MRWFSTPFDYLRSRLIHRAYHDAPTVATVLRPYQEQCLDTCLEALASGVSRIGVSLPTGSGKTTVFVSLLSRLVPSAWNPVATRSLIIVNSVELARQSASQVASLFPRWSVEIEQGAKYKASGFADVTIATYQTLNSAERLAKFNPHKLKAVIIDEAHHAAAPSYRKLLAHFHPDIKHPDPLFAPPSPPHRIPIVGFSATFSRHDGLALGSIFERIVYHRDFLEMIKEQWLCPVRVTSVRASIDLKNVTINTRTGDFNPTSLAHVINTETINNLVVKTWIDRASTRKSTLVFCVNVAHVHTLTQSFRQFGVDARYLHSGTPIAERKALIAMFKAGHFPVLVNCAILTEGADIPNIDCVLIARPTRSRNVFAQMIGRGMRLSPSTDKGDCHIIDLVGSLSKMSGVVSIPSLLGLNPAEMDIEDKSLESLEARASESTFPDSDVPTPTSITYKEEEDPFSVSSHGSSHVATLSRNSWVSCGDDIYVLECIGKGFIRIEPSGGEQGPFTAHYAPPMMDRRTANSLHVSPYMRSRQVLTAETLSDAISGCDTWVKAKILPGQLSLA
ncbi:hypothetical protein K443DRAFT_675026 [Laccaria amethystina LaAM-08-1]|uniref:P-loop containing nucleoside triphosphate hydrolase protein n=1 Tax=Laccaria amethystina LaAM-08-1 TaxID=1095629 RepID=A0A0C9YBL1_9AGAR|nr:hypothetical protein K443DRAFT_675026 [Laccaria amethystina LaAM-08-1]